jgi:hypothetical protein
MKKAIVIALLFIAASAFTQEFTFRGLPWGASVEDIIAKEGQPNNSSVSSSTTAFYNIRLIYLVALNGYNTRLDISFHDSKMSRAHYTINSPPFRDLDETQLNIAFLALLGQLVAKYGAYHEIFTDKTDKNYQCWVWHFNNFHIYIFSIGTLRTFEIGYCSNIAWNIIEEDLIRTMNRLPNRDL